MTTIEKIHVLLNRNFLLIGEWQGDDRQITQLDNHGNLTLQNAEGERWHVPLQDVKDIGFASRLVPDRYLPIDDFDTSLAARFNVFCQLTDLTDAAASQLLGRSVRLDELNDPDDWKTICAGLIGL